MVQLLILTYNRNNEKKGKYAKIMLLSFFVLHSFCAICQNNALTKESSNRYFFADSLYRTGKTFVKKGQYQKGLNIIQESLTIFKKIGDQKAAGNCLNKIGSIYFYQGDYPKALSFYQESISLHKKVPYKKGVSSTLNNIGAIHYYLGSYPKALDYYKKAVKIQEEINDTLLATLITQNIGGIYVELKDYTNGMKYYQKAKEVYQKADNKKALAQVLNGIGEIYMKQKDYNHALINFESSLKLAEKIEDKQKVIEVLFNLGKLYDLQKKHNKSLKYYHNSLKLSKEINSQLFNSLSLIAIGSTNYQQKNHLIAINECKEGLKIAENLKAISVQKDACKCLYDKYKSINKKGKALAYYEQMNMLDDSLQSQKTADKILNMEFQKQVLIDSIAHVEKERKLQVKHKHEVQKKEKQRNVFIISGAFILLFAVGLWNRLNFVKKSKSQLQIEKDRSEHLLLNILPEKIAEELKEKGYVDAQDFETTSILFTDFKSFTETASKLSPQELVEEINICFKAFDAIMDKYNIEKIKTIGDAYMAAGGLPKASTDSVKKTVLAGLDMQEFITKRKINNDLLNKPAFEMRVGIHVGPIVAGIVGVKKFQYDIWGDTVNTASRIESNGAVGKVNISQQVYNIIKNENDLRFDYRGNINAKGKGEIKMYFVQRRKF